MKLYYNPNLKTDARNLRKAGNLAEVLLWKELWAKKLGVQFLRQRPIGNYIVDFYCHKLHLAIEIDGVSHDSKIEKDAVRQNMLESQGVQVLRFADKEVRYNLDSVLREIKKSIKSLGLPATPFRKGRINPPVHQNDPPTLENPSPPKKAVLPLAKGEYPSPPRKAALPTGAVHLSPARRGQGLAKLHVFASHPLTKGE